MLNRHTRPLYFIAFLLFAADACWAAALNDPSLPYADALTHLYNSTVVWRGAETKAGPAAAGLIAGIGALLTVSAFYGSTAKH